MTLTERSQAVLIWWGLISMYIYGLCMWGLFEMLPPPAATLTPEEVKAFYLANSGEIRVGAMITSWVSAFAVPIQIVAGFQILRLERELGYKVPLWTTVTIVSGVLMSMFLVFPPIIWGVAAFSPERDAQVTAAIHELGLLTLTTTDQYYIFGMVAIAFISLKHKGDRLSPFPRWMGYFTIWAAFMFELGAIAFIPKTGPFSWNGLFVFWCPLTIYGSWITAISVTMLIALKRQRLAGAQGAAVDAGP